MEVWLSEGSLPSTAQIYDEQFGGHYAYPEDSARGADTGAGCDPTSCSWPAADHPGASRGQDRGARTGGSAVASPVLTNRGNLHPDTPPYQGRGRRAEWRQVFSRPRRACEGRGARAADQGHSNQTQPIWRPGEHLLDGISPARLPANDLPGHQRLRPPALQF